jgi:hypothetical protein
MSGVSDLRLATVIFNKQKVSKKTPVNKLRNIRAGFLERQIKWIN